jgi:hypothetical protein
MSAINSSMTLVMSLNGLLRIGNPEISTHRSQSRWIRTVKCAESALRPLQAMPGFIVFLVMGFADEVNKAFRRKMIRGLSIANACSGPHSIQVLAEGTVNRGLDLCRPLIFCQRLRHLAPLSFGSGLPGRGMPPGLIL